MGLNLTGRPSDLLSTLVSTPVAITGTTALTSSAFDKLHVCSDAGSPANYTLTLPDPTGKTGKLIGFRMAPGLTKLVTLAQHASEVIDGAATRVLWASETAFLLTDGTDWFKVAGKSIPMTCVLQRSLSDFSVTPINTWYTVPMDGLLGGSSLLYDSSDGWIVIQRAGTYTISAFVFVSTGLTESIATYVAPGVNSSTNPFGLFQGFSAASNLPCAYTATNSPLAVGDAVKANVRVLSGTSPIVIAAGVSTVSVTETPTW